MDLTNILEKTSTVGTNLTEMTLFYICLSILRTIKHTSPDLNSLLGLYLCNLGTSTLTSSSTKNSQIEKIFKSVMSWMTLNQQSTTTWSEHPSHRQQIFLGQSLLSLPQILWTSGLEERLPDPMDQLNLTALPLSSFTYLLFVGNAELWTTV